MMNKSFSYTKLSALLFVGLISFGSLNAQSKKKKSRPPVDSYGDIPVQSNSAPKKSKVPAADTTELPTDSYASAADTMGINPNLPVTVIKDSSNGGLFSDNKKSLRRDGILEDDATDSTATPLPYTPLYSTDAVYRVRVWRVIDGTEKANLPYFFNSSIDGEDNTRLINVIFNAIKNDSVQAFSSIDDRFTTPITFQQALDAFGSGTDTSASYDLNGNIVGYQVRQKALNPDSIYKFRIKEEWVFNKRDGKTYVRILGIAPLISYTMSNGDVADNSEHAAFWIYYPDLRTALVRSLIPNPLNIGGTMTWEEVFEKRLFTSHIIKSTLDTQNGFTKEPLTGAQGQTIQQELNNLSGQMWKHSAQQ
ncbi:hypothetical protein A9P82_07020 [Arachidicoccus ginsenosidimutans]|uniref:type IX secretion system ring protein PorN/GldN n=1 Tax=Arachidicoccus sp. BS20 TaxID=1850526 RepID=UPI0007F08CCA|nr:gliding motility protein GldN [Arachidicoccus sp. BS20]ANI89060.1 hypothetical protein A9P82_07020 [Arachidicoccus sp. BS20]